MSFPLGVLYSGGLAQPNVATPFDLTKATSLHSWVNQVSSATGVFAALNLSPPPFLDFKDIAFADSQMASLWSVSLNAGLCSFDVTSMLMTITTLTFRAQGNGVVHIPVSSDAFCAFSLSATWPPQNASSAAFLATFGAYAGEALEPPTNLTARPS